MKAKVAAGEIEVISIDPVVTSTHEYLGREHVKHIAVNPQTDVPLQLALAYTLYSENLYDKNFLANYCVGFEQFLSRILLPSASVTVNLLPGRALDEGQISAIVHLVSSAVAGLPPGNVTLVDQGGHLLTQSNTSGRDLNDAQLKYASDVEGRIQRRIEAILSPIVGNGNIHAQVTAQLDFASKEQTEEQYRPNGDESHAALRSRQLNESEQSGSGYPGGVPGALSNQPAPANNAPISTPPANQNNRQQQASTTSNSGPRSTQRNETSNYEVDRTIRHTKMNVGDVQRLSVAVE